MEVSEKVSVTPFFSGGLSEDTLPFELADISVSFRTGLQQSTSHSGRITFLAKHSNSLRKLTLRSSTDSTPAENMGKGRKTQRSCCTRPSHACG